MKERKGKHTQAKLQLLSYCSVCYWKIPLANLSQLPQLCHLQPLAHPSDWDSNRLGKGKGFDAVQSLFSNSYQHCLSHRSKTAQQGLYEENQQLVDYPGVHSAVCIALRSVCTSNHTDPASRENRSTQDFLLKSLIKFQAFQE